jgi:ABC-type Na+ efflux pump permease subunit
MDWEIKVCQSYQKANKCADSLAILGVKMVLSLFLSTNNAGVTTWWLIWLPFFYLFIIKKRNAICTTIFVQLLYNFLTHTHIIFLFSLFFFLSPLFLTNEKREQQGCPESCTKIVVQISLLY